MTSSKCAKCSAEGGKIFLTMCPICHKMICETCQFIKGGRPFCSQYCAEYFFFGDEE